MTLTTKAILITSLTSIAIGCSNGESQPDAYGNFEADDIVISAQIPGEIMELNIAEGQTIKANQKIGYIDTTEIHLSKLEVKANKAVIQSQFANLAAEIGVLKTERDNVERELRRIEKLLKDQAAAPQALDDMKGRLEVVQKRIATVQSRNPSVFAQLEVADAKLAQLNERIERSQIVNPMNGTVLTQIAHAHEFTATGMPLYKLADLSSMILRAYVDGGQLHAVKIGASVECRIDCEDGWLKSLPGTVEWISDVAEFTPKIIQTRDERTDLVYAVKIRVLNDGSIKSGMPGELYLSSKTADAEN